MAGEYYINDIYQGGDSSFKPNYGDVFTGYHIPSSTLGAPTNPFTANQIAEADKLLRQGIVPIEVGTIKPEDFEAIPKQHFKEIQRMAKLTDAKISIHSPLIEASGIGEGGWSEVNKQAAEIQLKDVVEKSYDADHRGNIPITIHSANIPGAGTEYVMEKGKKKVEKMAVINQDTGQISPLKEEISYYPGGEVRKEVRKPEESLRDLNNTEWSNSLREIEFSRESAERVLENIHPKFNQLYIDVMFKGKRKDLSPEEMEEIKKIHSASEFMQQAQLRANTVFTKVYKDAERRGNKKALGYLNELSKVYGDVLGDPRKDAKAYDPRSQSHAMFQFLQGLKNPGRELDLTPQVYRSVTDFAMEQSADTFSNVALHSFKKFGTKAPVISIENLYPGYAFSTGEEMNDLILTTKNQFVDKATKSTKEGGLGLSKSKAQKEADRLIGLTFDVGHLNIHRKHGFSEEDLRKEFEAMSKHIKHVHLTDNFGSFDSHLPPGMGNVPFKQYMKELEKQGFKGSQIVEAGGFAKHFETSPYPITLQAFGAGPYQGSVSPYQGYFSGLGPTLPQAHYEMLGAGFSQLPVELGGERFQGGDRGRMAG